MKLKEIENYLKDNDIKYEVTNPNFEINVFPANFKKIIDFGLYHVSDEFNGTLDNINHSIVICTKKIDGVNTCIIVSEPQLVHYKLSTLFEVDVVNKIHTTAIIDKDAVIGDNVNIGPYSVIGKCVIEDNVNIQSHVVVTDNVIIKKNVFIDSNSNIGQKGIVWVWDEKGNRINQAQLGGVIIEEDVYLGTDITIVRGSLSESTIVGKGSVLSHGTKIGHGAIIGKYVHMANNVSLAGNTTIEDRCYLGSGSVIPSNVTIPKHAIVGAGAMVNKNFNEEYLTLVGVPAKILYNENFKRKGKGTPIPHK